MDKVTEDAMRALCAGIQKNVPNLVDFYFNADESVERADKGLTPMWAIRKVDDDFFVHYVSDMLVCPDTLALCQRIYGHGYSTGVFVGGKRARKKMREALGMAGLEDSSHAE